MCENAHNLRKTMHLTDIEELENLHLKSKTGIDEKQDLEYAVMV